MFDGARLPTTLIYATFRELSVTEFKFNMYRVSGSIPTVATNIRNKTSNVWQYDTQSCEEGNELNVPQKMSNA